MKNSNFPSFAFFMSDPSARQQQQPAKAVVTLACHICSTVICTRGLRGRQIGDASKQLYSSDSVLPHASIALERPYSTNVCACTLDDLACASW